MLDYANGSSSVLNDGVEEGDEGRDEMTLPKRENHHLRQGWLVLGANVYCLTRDLGL